MSRVQLGGLIPLCSHAVYVVCVNKHLLRGRKIEIPSQYYWTSNIAHHSVKQMKKHPKQNKTFFLTILFSD